jgi:ABC-type transport system substrate-binding protein
MKYPGPRIYYAGMNVNLPPFNQKLVRQALNYAVDKDRILQIINGRGIKMGSTLPPWMPGHDEKIKPYAYDVNKAKELLKKAGLEKGFSADLLVPDYAYQPQVAAQVQADLAKVGVTVNYQVQPLATVRTQLRTPNKVPFFLLQWGTDFPDPSNVISTLFNGASGLNFAYFKNPKVDELIAKADVEKDAKKRLALYNQADKIIVEEAPWIFLFYGISDGLKSAKVFPNDPSFFVDPLGSRKIDSVWKAN